MSVARRLEELGVALPPPAAPVGMYRAALRSGRWILTSGQLSVRDGAIVHPGRVGDDVTIEEGRDAARIALLNALAAVQALHGTLDGLRVVRLVGYVASTAELERHAEVVNGASELLRDLFGDDAGLGTRLALGVASLPLRSPVELELVLEVEGADA